MKLYSLIPAAVLLAAASLVGALQSTTVASGGLIKGSLPAVYLVGADGKRYVFPNDKTYFSWYADFTGVNKISDAELASYTIGGNVTYRPGTRLVKIQSDPKVYAVANGGVLRWVKTEAAAVALYGSDWNKKVDDLSDSFFTNYTVGTDISSASDFSPATETARYANYADELSNNHACSGAGCGNTNANGNVNTNTNVPVSTSACTPACGLGSACVTNQCQVVPGPSAMKVTAYLIDTLNTCFVGDACTGGACCTIAGNQFADNANLKAVRPVDKYLYADKQQLCGRATVSTNDRNRITQELNDFADGVAADTQNRMSVSVNQTRITGDFSMSRIPGTCNWWVSPDDLRDRLQGQIDNTTDSVFIVSSRNFDFGTVSELDANTADQTAGLAGAGYSYIVKEWETDVSGAPAHGIYTSAFKAQMDSSVELGITKPNASFIGNHCRDLRRDFDETGVDCGGTGCNACTY